MMTLLRSQWDSSEHGRPHSRLDYTLHALLRLNGDIETAEHPADTSLPENTEFLAAKPSGAETVSGYARPSQGRNVAHHFRSECGPFYGLTSILHNLLLGSDPECPPKPVLEQSYLE